MLSSQANNYSFLFLGGILGEFLEHPLIGNYLWENERILKELQIDEVDCLTLNSLKSANQNAEKLIEIINERFERANKKIIVFAHSKACLEVIIALFMNPQIFETKVEHVICVQPPFAGSALLDNFALRPIMKLWPGLECLRKEYYSNYFEQNSTEEIRSLIQKKLLVIKGHHPNTKVVCWIIRTLHILMKKLGLQNDGLLALNEQILPSMNYREMTLEIDHSDLFTSTRLSGKSEEFRKTLMSKLINDLISNSAYNSNINESQPAKLH